MPMPNAMQSISMVSLFLHSLSSPDISSTSPPSVIMPASSSRVRRSSVFSSMYSGTLMCTLLPLRFRMLAVRVEKRGWGLMRSSEHVEEHATGPSGVVGGLVKSVVPINGKDVTVGTISSLSNDASNRRLRSLKEGSTRRRSRTKPPKGRRGVPSTIHDPYSGCHAHASFLLSERPLLCSLSRRVSSTSVARSDSRTFRCARSIFKMGYSSSSPHNSFSLLRSLFALYMWMNCNTPCSRTYPNTSSDFSNGRGVPTTSSPPPRNFMHLSEIPREMHAASGPSFSPYLLSATFLRPSSPRSTLAALPNATAS
mmetsp:Transcript_27329/g.55854  ORF Transcript_27329/g.55854 Transcript_27329/m.55854 type:complete len:311 (-) Transcript_27329:180-1112(-)